MLLFFFLLFWVVEESAWLGLESAPFASHFREIET